MIKKHEKILLFVHIFASFYFEKQDWGIMQQGAGLLLTETVAD